MKGIYFLFSIFSVATGIFAFNSKVYADSNQCPQRMNVGYKCYQDRSISARSGYPGSDTGTFTFQPPPGYIISNYEIAEQAKFGAGGNVNINLSRGGAYSNLQSTIDSFNRSLSDSKSKFSSYATVPIEGVPVTLGGEIEAVDKALVENSSRLQMMNRSYSNVDTAQASVTVSGRCTRHVFGRCANNQGGKYEGYVRFYLEYVGTPQEIIAANEAAINRARNALASLEQARNNSSINQTQYDNNAMTGIEEGRTQEERFRREREEAYRKVQEEESHSEQEEESHSEQEEESHSEQEEAYNNEETEN